MSRKKVYRYGTIANLNTSGEEVRQAILYGALQGRISEQFNNLGQWINEHSQLVDPGWPQSGTGVKHRNYIIWARDKPFTDYNRDDLYAQDDGTYEKDPCTFNNLSEVVNPTVSMALDLTDDEVNDVVSNYLDIDLEDEDLTQQTITVTGITDDGTLVPDIEITADIHRTWTTVIKTQYVGSYNVQYLGEAYIYAHGEDYVESNEWFRYGLVSGNTFVEIAQGDEGGDVDEGDDTEEGTEVTVEGDSDHAWFYWGYNTTEYHIDEEYDKEVYEEVFNEEIDEYVALDDWVNTQVSGFDKYTTKFFILAGYIYPTDTITGYAGENGYVKVTQVGDTYEPVEEEGNEITLTYTYEFELEDYEKTYTETYETNSALENYKFFSIVTENSTAASDSTLGSLTTDDLEDVELDMSPPIAIKRKTGEYEDWVTEDRDRKWYWRNWRACKQEYGDEDYFDEVFESLQEQITDSVIKNVFLMYGLPCNMCQLSYCADYAIWFFKVLAVPNWQEITIGEDYSYTGGNRSYEAHANAHNYHFKWYWDSVTYVTGSGDCPAYDAYTDDEKEYWELTKLYPGAGGCVNYQDKPTIWRQYKPNAWEYVQVTGYHNEFTRVYQSKGYTISNTDTVDVDGVSTDVSCWFVDIWEDEKEGITRQYSKTLLPISRVVLKQMAMADWTDCVQYIHNVGATGYKVVRKKWYQTGLFKFILIIVIVIIVVICCVYQQYQAAQAVGAAGTGLIAAAQALLWNLIIKVAVSLAVSVILQYVLAPILTDLFGPIIGQILTTIVQIYCCYQIIGFASTGSLPTTASTMTELTKASSWLQIANAGVKGYVQGEQAELAADAKQLQKDTEQMYETVDDTYTAIAKLYQNDLGYTSPLAQETGRNMIASNKEDFVTSVEGPESYFNRALLSGSDIAEMTVKCVGSFCDLLFDNTPYANIA